jgi:hypothetical protein
MQADAACSRALTREPGFEIAMRVRGLLKYKISGRLDETIQAGG